MTEYPAPQLPYGAQPSDASSGPNWWLASDGRWYPPRWEYHYFATSNRVDLNSLTVQALQQAALLGQQGWEVVNFTVQSHASKLPASGWWGSATNEAWSIFCFLKRPVTP
jgi:hypothetical protein